MLTYDIKVTAQDIRRFRENDLECPLTEAITRWANRKLQTDVIIWRNGHIDLTCCDDKMTFALDRQSRRFQVRCHLYHAERQLVKAEEWSDYMISPQWIAIEL